MSIQKRNVKLPRPSSAYMEIECPASRRLAERISKYSTFYADEGTAAHELAALCLRDGSDARAHLGAKIMPEFTVNTTMADNVQEYVDIVREYRDGKLTGDVTLLVEHKFRYGGTLDAVLYNEAMEIHIFDYKNGAQPVSAENNAQMLCYANSLIQEMDFLYSKLVLHIVQPNIMRGDAHSMWEVPAGELERFMSNLLLKAEEAESSYPEMKVGQHCRFCAANIVCPKLKDEVFFSWRNTGKGLRENEYVLPAPEDLTSEQISKALQAGDYLRMYLSNLYVYAQNKAQEGMKIPGYKMASSLGNRTWKDEAEAETALKPIMDEDELYTKKMVTMPQAEKILKKKIGKREADKALDGLFHRKEGNLKLVPDTADGKEVNIVALKDKFKQFITQKGE